MECEILNILEFDITRPTPLDFLRRYSRAADNTDQAHITARYLIEMATMNSIFMTKKVSLLAAGAVYLGRCMCRNEPYWDETMAFYSGYSENDLIEIAHTLNDFNAFMQSPQNKYTKIQEKYSDDLHQHVSTLPPCDDIIFSFH